MFQQESIYNLLPHEKILPPHFPLYKPRCSPTLLPTGTTFNLHNTSFPNVANWAGEEKLPITGHPLHGSFSTFGRPWGSYQPDPNNFIKKNHIYKMQMPRVLIRSKSEIRKPPVPTLLDKPIMGWSSQKNYVIANAVDASLLPRKGIKQQSEDFLNKKGYGVVPKYLIKMRGVLENERRRWLELHEKEEENERKKRYKWNNDELERWREGLEKKLEILKRSYGAITHKSIFDTLICKNKKENIEKEIDIIEKDLEKLNNKNVIVDMR